MNKTTPSLTKLRSFATIAHKGSFQRAADYLGVSQPALSAQLSALEKELGVALLHRTTRQISLTEHGARLLARVDRAFFELDLISSDLRDEVQLQKGRVLVASVPTIAAGFMPTTIKRFSSKYPQVLVQISDLTMGEVIESVKRGYADFGVGPSDGTIEDCYCEVIGNDELVLCCPKEHIFTQQNSIRLAELKSLPLIVLERKSNTWEVLDKAFARKGFQFEPRFVVNHHLTLVMMVKEGLGFGVLPSFAVGMAHNLDIDFVPISHPKLKRSISILMRNGARLSPAASKLAELTRNGLEEASIKIRSQLQR